CLAALRAGFRRGARAVWGLYLALCYRQVGPGTLERTLVGAGIDDEEEIARLERLIVDNGQLHDRPAHVWRDAHDIGAHVGVVGAWRAPVELEDPQGDQHRRDDDRRPDRPAEHPPSHVRQVRYNTSHVTRVTSSPREG